MLAMCDYCLVLECIAINSLGSSYVLASDTSRGLGKLGQITG